jgi:hypothetical protein
VLCRVKGYLLISLAKFSPSLATATASASQGEAAAKVGGVGV